MSDQVVALYEKAISSLHAKNLILYLAFADFEEQQMRIPSAHKIYKDFLSQEDIDPTLVIRFFKEISIGFMGFHKYFHVFSSPSFVISSVIFII